MHSVKTMSVSFIILAATALRKALHLLREVIEPISNIFRKKITSFNSLMSFIARKED